MSHPLHEKAVHWAKTYLHSEKELFSVLYEIAEAFLLPKLGYSGMWQYLEKGLGLSECQSGYYRRVLHKARVFPLLREAVCSGTLSLSKARRICGVMEEATQSYWIDAALRLKQRPLERLVREKHPRNQVKEGLFPIDKEHTEMRVVLTVPEQEKVEKAQGLFSQKTNEAKTLSETVAALASFYLEKNDPVLLAQKASLRTEKKRPLVKPGSHTIQRSLKHQVYFRDGFRCTQKEPDGSRCEATRWLHLHHRTPVSEGGVNSLQNLTLLCSAHHRIHHQATR